MTKWYKQGYKDATDGLPCDPPMRPGHRSYDEYLAGFKDGEEVGE